MRKRDLAVSPADPLLVTPPQKPRAEAQLDPYYFSRPGACRFVSLGLTTLDGWIKDGTLPVLHIGRAVRIRRDDLLRVVEAQTLPPAKKSRRVM